MRSTDWRRSRITATGILTAALVIAAAVLPSPVRAQEEPVDDTETPRSVTAFKDVMEEVGLADPTLTWHGYHDSIYCADWDDDGDVDVVVVVSPHSKSPHKGTARLFVNLLTETGKLGFEDRTERLMPGGINKKVYADTFSYFLDLDADGDLDLASISDESRPVTFRNNGKGVFSLEPWGFIGSWLVIQDFDGDGDLDVLSKETGHAYVNDGRGRFTLREDAFGWLCGRVRGEMPVPPGVKLDAETRQKAAVPHMYFVWERIDLNGDDIPDYILMLSQAYGFKWTRFYAGSGDGKYRDVTVETGLPPSASIDFADVNGDGINDAYVLCRAREAGIYLGDGKGHFTRAEDSHADKYMRVTSGGCYMEPQVLVDFNNDGVLDLATMRYRAGTGSALFEGLGGGRFKLVQRTGAEWGQCVVDLDNDGLMDVIAAGPQPGVHLWRNVSTGTGGYLRLFLKGSRRNPRAAGATVEVYPAGSLGKPDKRIGKAVAAADGLPLHFGLGKHGSVDLKVTFPDRKAVEKRDIRAGQTLIVASEN